MEWLLNIQKQKNLLQIKTVGFSLLYVCRTLSLKYKRICSTFVEVKIDITILDLRICRIVRGVVYFSVFAHGICLQSADRVIKYPVLNVVWSCRCIIDFTRFQVLLFHLQNETFLLLSYCISCGIALYKSLLFLL